ncbi:MAG TPA: class I SAM-dependent methyltransferase [Rhabdochlamydiaceae bacterium]|jgi:predicted O-methyltransferase YrrM|nr:class I SAM-dependent methyltransferase [Rhabdochlamydiaceae bacterium]
MKKLCFLLCTLSFLVPLVANYPSPYDSIEVLPFNPQGWYINGPSMEWLIRRGNVKIIIEVGSWLGLSTRHLAKTIPEDGIVYAVDHWKGSPNEDNSSFDIPNLYRQFLSNVIHENLTHKIVPVRMSSLEASQVLKVKPDLIYLDATHDFTNVMLDLIVWFPLVKGHGTMCGDDYFWADDPSKGGGPVKRAVDTFARENNLTVRHDGRWMWYLEEKK